VIGIGAAQEHAGLLAGAAAARHVDASLQAQQVDQVRRAAGVDIRARDHADIGQARSDGFGDARGGDFDGRLQCAFLRPYRWRQREADPACRNGNG